MESDPHTAAIAQAAAIRTYWRNRGYPEIKAWVEVVEMPWRAVRHVNQECRTLYLIKTNIGPTGYPQKAK